MEMIPNHQMCYQKKKNNNNNKQKKKTTTTKAKQNKRKQIKTETNKQNKAKQNNEGWLHFSKLSDTNKHKHTCQDRNKSCKSTKSVWIMCYDTLANLCKYYFYLNMCKVLNPSVMPLSLYLLPAFWMCIVYVGEYIAGVTKLSNSFQIKKLMFPNWMPQLQQAAKQNIYQKSNYLLKW